MMNPHVDKEIPTSMSPTMTDFTDTIGIKNEAINIGIDKNPPQHQQAAVEATAVISHSLYHTDTCQSKHTVFQQFSTIPLFMRCIE
jgi:hypothetical protein